MTFNSHDRFGDTAQRLCALAARALGWRPDEFWRATPQELACVLRPDADTTMGAAIDRATLNAMMEHDHGR